MANLDKSQSATMSADQIKQNIKSALDIQLLPVETKREICKLYDIVAKAAIMKNESDAVEKAECEQIIQNNSELFSIITNPMFYSSILLGPVSDYFSDSDKLNMPVINGKHNYTALMFKSLTTFTGCASKVIAPADNVNVNAIPGLLQLYNTPEAEYDPSLDETFDFDKDSTESDVKWDDNDIFSDKEGISEEELDAIASEIDDEESKKAAEEDKSNEEDFDTALTEEEKKEQAEIEELKKAWSSKVKPVVDGIMKAYDKLYESCYGLMPPIGILTNKGIIKTTSEGNRITTGTPATDIEIFLNLVKVLGDKYASYAAAGEEPDIEKLYSLGKPIIYTDLHLKFMFGHLNFCKGRVDGLRAYLTKHNIKNASDSKIIKYSSIRGWIRETVEGYFYKSYRTMGVTSDITPEMFDIVNSVNTTLSNSLKNVIAVVEKNPNVNIKFRICSDSNIDTAKIIAQLKSNLNVGSASLIDVTQTGKASDGVVDINVIYNQMAFSQDALFAYEVLGILEEQDIKPSWNNVILGKKDDGTIMTYNFKDSNNSVLALYGSKGSGKGVMTLNLISSALADDCTLMYMDAKPDTAIPLVKVVWDKGLDAVVYNGKETPGASLEGQGSCPRTVDRFVAKQNVPEGLFKTESSLEKFLLLNTYYRGLELFLELAEDRASIVTNGGHNDNWLVAIFDEVQQLATTEDTVMKYLESMQKERTKATEEVDGKVKKINYMQDPIYRFIIDYKGWRDVLVDRLATALGSTFRKAEVTSIYIWQTSDYPGSYKNTSIIAKALMQESSSVVKIMGRGAAAANGGSIVYGTKSNIEKEATWYDTRFSGKLGGYWAIGNNVNTDSSMTVFRPFNVYSNANDKALLVRNAEANGLTEADLIGKSLNTDGSVKPEIGFEAYSDKLLAMSGKTAAQQLNLGYTRINQFIQNKGLAKSVEDYMYSLGTTASSSNNSAEALSSVDLDGESTGETPTTFTSQGEASEGTSSSGYMQNEIDKAKGAAESTRNLNVISCREAYALVSMDNSVRDTLENRIFKEFTQQSPNFNLFKRDKTAYGLHHLCYNISIWGAILGYSRVPVNTNQNIKAFCENYLKMLVAGSISPDAIPRDDHIIRMAGLTPENINNMQSQGEQSVTEAELPNENIDEEVDINSINPEEFTIDNNLKEKIIDNNRLAQILAALAASQFNTQNGNRVINTNNKMGQLIELNDTNFMNTRSPYTGSFMEKLLVRTESGRSQIFTNGIKAVIGAIDKKIPDRGAVTRIIASGNTLVVNGMLVDLAPVLDNNDYGLRFQDLVNVKQLLNHYKGIEELGLDNIMFEQIIEDYGTTAQELWLLFQNNGRLRKLIVQLTPGGEERVITRQDYRNHAAELQSSAKQRKFAMQTDAMANINNPRLSDLGVGVVSGSYKLAGGMGEQFVKRLTSDNPKVFSGLGFGLLAAAAGTFAVLGTGVGFVGDKIGGLFRRKK